MAPTSKARRDVAEEVTTRILTALEEGTVPWAQPWTTRGMLPTSLATGHAYRGINVWLLQLTAMAEDYSSPYWCTFKQAKALGGSVRKGEKSTQVVFWKRIEVADREANDGSKKRIWLMRGFNVFNLEQCDDVKLPPRFVLEEHEPVAIPDALTEVLEGYADGPTVEYTLSDSAHYTPATDTVTLPALDQWESLAGLANTTLHELTHSTGHSSRLDRFGTGDGPMHFGSERYAREELVAEMGAHMLGALAGIDVTPVEQSAAYIEGWLTALQDDRKMLVSASQAAQKAVDRILGTQPQEATEAA